MKRTDPRFQPMLNLQMASIMSSGLEEHSTAIENRIDLAWSRAALTDHYALQGGEVVALQMALGFRKPDFMSYPAAAQARLSRAFAGGYVCAVAA